jgi:ssDNA-binding Zn-finger/Zn-ribbon topoisomerase 1
LTLGEEKKSKPILVHKYYSKKGDGANVFLILIYITPLLFTGARVTKKGKENRLNIKFEQENKSFLTVFGKGLKGIIRNFYDITGDIKCQFILQKKIEFF